MSESRVQILRDAQGDGGGGLLCLPFAGGSAWSFVPLARMAPRGWWVGALRQGPAERQSTLEELAADVATVVQATFTEPGVVLGHSLGAVVAYRAAQLAGSSWPQEAALVLSAPPSLRSVAENAARLLSMPAAGLLAEMRRLRLAEGLRHDDEVLTRLVVPGFRADLSILTTYRHSCEPLPVKPVLIAGTRDSSTPPCAIHALARELGAHAVLEIDGDHLYVVSRPADVVSILIEVLRHGAPTSGWTGPPIPSTPGGTA